MPLKLIRRSVSRCDKRQSDLWHIQIYGVLCLILLPPYQIVSQMFTANKIFPSNQPRERLIQTPYTSIKTESPGATCESHLKND
jgi:hypothetical protein